MKIDSYILLLTIYYVHY